MAGSRSRASSKFAQCSRIGRFGVGRGSRTGPVRGSAWFVVPGLGRPAGQAQLAGDQHALDLRGALAYLEDLRVAVEAADRGLVHEAVAAEYLGSGPRVVHRRVRR